MKPHIWTAYSQLFSARVVNPLHVGCLEEGGTGEMRIVSGKRAQVHIYLAVDTTDGTIADAKFQAFGESALIGIADLICETAIEKSYAYGDTITLNFLEKKVRDHRGRTFPQEVASAFHIAIAALKRACEKCRDLPLFTSSADPSADREGHDDYPPWHRFTREEKIGEIERVIAEEIQPYIERDGGEVEVIGLREEEVLLAYRGACVTCPYAMGETLHAIRALLRAKIHPKIEVTPIFPPTTYEDES